MMKLHREAVRAEFILPSIVALAITLFLFYIDEGKYNFDGILQADNLLFLIVYGALFFYFQKFAKKGFEYFIGNGKSQRINSGTLASLSLLFALALFFWRIKSN